MQLPDTLTNKIETFRATGRVPLLTEESYHEPSWVAIFAGNHFLPYRYDPLVDRLDPERLCTGLSHRRRLFVHAAEAMPPHEGDGGVLPALQGGRAQRSQVAPLPPVLRPGKAVSAVPALA